MSDMQSAQRIRFLDGLRGLAILAVLLYHGYVRWPALYVYGDRFAGIPWLDTRTAGVHLFFLISGFVILMTLQSCRSFWEFMLRRWLRLFPAMLLCSLIILLTAGLLPERPGGDIHSWDLLPGLSFVGDFPGPRQLWDAFAQIFGVHPSSIESSFWSLYVEVRFYFVFGLAYFVLGETWSVGLIALLYVLALLVISPWLDPSSAIYQLLSRVGIHSICAALDAGIYGFFASGALFYLYYRSRNRTLLWLAAVMGIAAALSVTQSRAANVVLTLLFMGAVLSHTLQRVLSNRLLLFLGFVSYPLYLLHENMVVALIIKLGRLLPQAPAVLIPVLPMSLVVALAWLVARYLEPATRSVLEIRRWQR